VYEHTIEGDGMVVGEVPNATSITSADELFSLKLYVTSEGAADISVMNAIITGIVFVT
jgi:hypothetical protein